MSASRMATLWPLRLSPFARMPQTSDLPTPPLPEITPTTCLMLDEPLT